MHAGHNAVPARYPRARIIAETAGQREESRDSEERRLYHRRQ